MRICWFNDNRLGLVQGDRVRDASTALQGLPKPAYPFPPKGDPLIANLDSLKPLIRAAAEGGASFPVNEVRFLSPVEAMLLIEVPWPPMCLVVECTTTAAPCSIGRQRTEAAVLSTISGTPSSRPIRATSPIGKTSSFGLGRISA